MSKLTIAYVFTGDPTSPYGTMLCASVLSLGDQDIEWTTLLVCDSETARNTGFAALEQLFDRVERVECDGDSLIRSRHLKTTLLNHLDGEFLYLDCDTLVCGSLEELHNFKSELAMAYDLDAQGVPLVLPQAHYQTASSVLGSEAQSPPFFNSGVIRGRVSNTTKSLWLEWHKLWLAVGAAGEWRDQASLGIAIDRVGIAIEHLPQKFNALVRCDERQRYGAVILHTQASLADLRSNSAYANILRLVSVGKQSVTAQRIRNELHKRIPIVYAERARNCYYAGNFLGAVRQYIKQRLIKRLP